MFRFGRFEVDPGRGELSCNGEKVRLQEKPFKLLTVLLQHPGEIVSRDEVRRQLWPADTFVEFDHGLNAAVKKLRAALRDSAENPRFIETIPRRGYRFIAPVSFDAEEYPLLSPQPTVAPPNSSISTRNRSVLAFSVALVVAIVGCLLLISRLRPSVTPNPIRSVAVLPLENLSADPAQEYFSDGLTDELITELARQHAFRVISRTSIVPYKGTRKPLPHIARELNVDAIVEGTVERSGDRVRVRVQLVRAASDEHIWAEAYDRHVQDLLQMQSEIAEAIAEKITVTLADSRHVPLIPTTQPSVAPDAYQAYLLGRHDLNSRTRDGLSKARQQFRKAVAIEPQFALAYAALADTYLLLGVYEVIPMAEAGVQAKEAAQQALAIDGRLAEAHTCLAGLAATYTWDWATAEREYRKAIELNPNYATAHQWYGEFLLRMGRFEEADQQMKQALELDPLSLIVNRNIGLIYLYEQRYLEAIQQLKTTIALYPNSPLAYHVLAWTYEQQGQLPEAIATYREAVRRGGHSLVLADLGRALASDGKTREAMRIIEKLKREHAPSVDVAVVYAGLRDRDAAFQWLDKAYDQRCELLAELKVDNRWATLRSDPRFQQLTSRMKLVH